MQNAKRFGAPIAVVVILGGLAAVSAAGLGASDFVSLFNGRDFAGWKVPAGDNGHWRVVDGVIDYDAESEAAGDKSLWTERSFGNFVLKVDWRLKATPYVNPSVPIILFDGTHKKDADGRETATGPTARCRRASERA